MSKSLRLTEPERQKVASLTADMVRERCREDRKFLGSIVTEYVGEAQLAKDAVLDRCQQDPAYLDDVVNHYLAGQSASAQVQLLTQNFGLSGVVARLGFNPFDPARETAYRHSTRFINSRSQMVVLLVGLAVIALMGLFPPWVKRDWRTQWGVLLPHSQVVHSEFAGYHFAFAEMPGPPSFSSWEGQREHTTYNWHVWLLLVQWLVWSLVVAGLCMALRDRKIFEQRIAEFGTKSDDQERV
jgi:hypothetical protein